MAPTDGTEGERQPVQMEAGNLCLEQTVQPPDGRDTGMRACEESTEAMLPAAEIPGGCRTSPHESVLRGNASYLNVDQACRLLQIGKSTFYRLLANPDSRLCDVAVRIRVEGGVREAARAVAALRDELC